MRLDIGQELARIQAGDAATVRRRRHDARELRPGPGGQRPGAPVVLLDQRGRELDERLEQQSMLGVPAREEAGLPLLVRLPQIALMVEVDPEEIAPVLAPSRGLQPWRRLPCAVQAAPGITTRMGMEPCNEPVGRERRVRDEPRRVGPEWLELPQRTLSDVIVARRGAFPLSGWITTRR